MRWTTPFAAPLVVALAAALPVPSWAAPVAAGTGATSAVVEQKAARAVLVMEMKSSSVDADTLRTITSTLAVSVSKRPGLSVLTGEDVKKLAEVEADKQMLGCDPSATSCLAEIAGAMGADLVLYGDIGKLGELYVVNLNLFEAGAAKAVGRQSVQSKAFDESFIAQLDITVRNLFAPLTGESSGLGSGSVGTAAVPTIDVDALKQSGLKSINIKAEQALEAALDAQESDHATPAQKRDAWCALASVEGANPYLEPATRACNDWRSFVVASEGLSTSLDADYATLSAFLDLRRKSKTQKLEAVDQFLKTYDRLADRQEVLAVREARIKVSEGAASPLPVDTDKDGLLVDRCPNEPEDKDGDSDTDGCPEKSIGESVADAGSGAAGVVDDMSDSITVLPLAFDQAPFFGASVGVVGHTSSFSPDDARDFFVTLGVRAAWAPVELAFNSSLDFDNRMYFGGYAGLQLFETPNKDYALLRPSLGIEAINFPETDEAHGAQLGAYVANTFRFSYFQVRLQYRYLFAGNLFPTHSLALQGSMDLIKLFEEQ
jgi:hypothetical protein